MWRLLLFFFLGKSKSDLENKSEKKKFFKHKEKINFILYYLKNFKKIINSGHFFRGHRKSRDFRSSSRMMPGGGCAGGYFLFTFLKFVAFSSVGFLGLRLNCFISAASSLSGVISSSFSIG